MGQQANHDQANLLRPTVTALIDGRVSVALVGHHSQFGPRVKSIRRYVQYHVLQDDPIREAMAQAGVSKVEPFDGVAIAWFIAGKRCVKT